MRQAVSLYIIGEPMTDRITWVSLSFYSWLGLLVCN